MRVLILLIIIGLAISKEFVEGRVADLVGKVLNVLLFVTAAWIVNRLLREFPDSPEARRALSSG